jgi:voltage-gated sodium channel
MKRAATQKFDDSEAWKLWRDKEQMLLLSPTREGAEDHWVDSTKFSLFIGAIILANAVSIGFETEYCGGKRGNCDDQIGWAVVEWIFSLAWLAEMAVRLRVYHLRYFRDPWNCLDFVLVVLAVVDTWILPYTKAKHEDMRMFSVLRMLRLLRLVRVVRLLRIFKELWLLVNGFIDALRVLGWLVVLLILILYCGAVIATMVIGDQCHEVAEEFPNCDEMFNGVFLSMFTLFQVLTLESWSMSVARPVMRSTSPLMVLFFVAFLFLTSFGLMNIVVGVIVENTLMAAEQNEEKVKKLEEEERSMILKNLQEIFIDADADKDGFVDRDEFETIMMRPDVQSKMEILELPSHEAKELFGILDGDHTGELDITEFIAGALKLKGAARAKDLMGVIVSQRGIVRRLEKFDGVPEQVNEMAPRLERIERLLEKIAPMAVQMPQVINSLTPLGGGTGEVPAGPSGSPPMMPEVPRPQAPQYLPPGCVEEDA